MKGIYRPDFYNDLNFIYFYKENKPFDILNVNFETSSEIGIKNFLGCSINWNAGLKFFEKEQNHQFKFESVILGCISHIVLKHLHENDGVMLRSSFVLRYH